MNLNSPPPPILPTIGWVPTRCRGSISKRKKEALISQINFNKKKKKQNILSVWILQQINKKKTLFCCFFSSSAEKKSRPEKFFSRRALPKDKRQIKIAWGYQGVVNRQIYFLHIGFGAYVLFFIRQMFFFVFRSKKNTKIYSRVSCIKKNEWYEN